jgi:hypothetical protein
MASRHILSEAEARAARREGLGTARGLVHGLLFTIGLWLALMGIALLILR